MATRQHGGEDTTTLNRISSIDGFSKTAIVEPIAPTDTFDETPSSAWARPAVLPDAWISSNSGLWGFLATSGESCSSLCRHHQLDQGGYSCRLVKSSPNSWRHRIRIWDDWCCHSARGEPYRGGKGQAAASLHVGFCQDCLFRHESRVTRRLFTPDTHLCQGSCRACQQHDRARKRDMEAIGLSKLAHFPGHSGGWPAKAGQTWNVVGCPGRRVSGSIPSKYRDLPFAARRPHKRQRPRR